MLSIVKSELTSPFSTSDGQFSFFRVKSIKDLQMNVNLCGGKFHGRVHVTHICDDVTEVREYGTAHSQRWKFAIVSKTVTGVVRVMENRESHGIVA